MAGPYIVASPGAGKSMGSMYFGIPIEYFEVMVDDKNKIHSPDLPKSGSWNWFINCRVDGEIWPCATAKKEKGGSINLPFPELKILGWVSARLGHEKRPVRTLERASPLRVNFGRIKLGQMNKNTLSKYFSIAPGNTGQPKGTP